MSAPTLEQKLTTLELWKPAGFVAAAKIQAVSAITPLNFTDFLSVVGADYWSKFTNDDVITIQSANAFQGFNPAVIRGALKLYAEGCTPTRDWTKDASFLISTAIERGNKVKTITGAMTSEGESVMNFLAEVYNIEEVVPRRNRSITITLARIALACPQISVEYTIKKCTNPTVPWSNMNIIADQARAGLEFPKALQNPAFLAFVPSTAVMDDVDRQSLIYSHFVWQWEFAKVINTRNNNYPHADPEKQKGQVVFYGKVALGVVDMTDTQKCKKLVEYGLAIAPTLPSRIYTLSANMAALGPYCFGLFYDTSGAAPVAKYVIDPSLGRRRP